MLCIGEMSVQTHAAVGLSAKLLHHRQTSNRFLCDKGLDNCETFCALTRHTHPN